MFLLRSVSGRPRRVPGVQLGMTTACLLSFLLVAAGGPAAGSPLASPAASIAAEAPRPASRRRPVEAPVPLVARAPDEAAFDAGFRAVFDDVLLPNGLVLDRRSDRNTVSCAATGFTAYALALMAQRGTADPIHMAEIVQDGFRTTLQNTPPKNGGWLYHFTDAAGHAKPWSEVSTVDSAIFYFGFLRAAETLGDAEFLAEVRGRIAAIDVGMMLKDGYFLHGLRWNGDKPVFLPYRWDDTSEGAMIYRLFDLPFRPRIVRHDYPLFVYYYPLCFFDDPDYSDRLRTAVRYQFEHYGYTGLTASDGPNGYQADDPQVISPLALFALSGLFPEARATLAKYGVDHMVPAYHVGSGWMAPDRVTIDYASAYILLVKPQTTAKS